MFEAWKCVHGLGQRCRLSNGGLQGWRGGKWEGLCCTWPVGPKFHQFPSRCVQAQGSPSLFQPEGLPPSPALSRFLCSLPLHFKPLPPSLPHSCTAPDQNIHLPSEFSLTGLLFPVTVIPGAQSQHLTPLPVNPIIMPVGISVSFAVNTILDI